MPHSMEIEDLPNIDVVTIMVIMTTLIIEEGEINSEKDEDVFFSPLGLEEWFIIKDKNERT